MKTTEQRSILRVVIVDDEEPARVLLRDLLGERTDVNVVAECANGFEAVKAVAAHEPDLLLLDIQMPKLNGFEVLELLERDIPVIFVTAYDEHALKAFEVHAVDYLLKPFTAQRLGEALTRVRDRLDRTQAPLDELLETARPDARFLERILVRHGADVHVVPVNDLHYIEACDDAVEIHLAKLVHRKVQRMSFLEKRLDPERFVRIHRSYILNVDRLQRIELYAKDSRVAILSDGTKLPVSRAGYGRLRGLL
jgi:two-component system LytT family response regulator